jgi:hypothetical protein
MEDTITFNVSVPKSQLPKLLEHLLPLIEQLRPQNEQFSSSRQQYAFPPIEQCSSSRQQYAFSPIEQYCPPKNPIEKYRDAIVKINQEIQTFNINEKFKVMIECMKMFSQIVVKFAYSKYDKKEIVDLCLFQLCRIQKCLMMINDEKTVSFFYKNTDFQQSVEKSAECIDKKTHIELNLSFGVPYDVFSLHVKQELGVKYDLY